ncbi:hypothetical protein AAEU28_18370 [Pseudoalteromonas sp. SS15]|uniref:hypothetical protein n=1 Tax=Pseudoalteromonas sp. SS15 TaxID=3139393 RepID=UPI003BAD3273
MKLKLNKKSVKNLSKDNKALPVNATPAVAGGVNTLRCITDTGSIACDRPTTYTMSIEICETITIADR